MKLLFTILCTLIAFISLGQHEYFWALQSKAIVFTPPADLYAWYKSDTGVTVSAGLATQWNDVSGNNYHLLSTVNNKPQYYTNQLNGYPSIEVDAASSGQTLQAGSNFPAFAGLTVYVVGHMISNTPNFGRLLDCDFQNGWWMGRSGTTNNLVGAAKAAGSPFGSVVPLSLSTWMIMSIRWDGSASIARAGNNTGPAFNSSGTTTPNKLALFANHNLSTYGKFKVTEILIFTRALTTDEDTYIRSYLTPKYAL